MNHFRSLATHMTMATALGGAIALASPAGAAVLTPPPLAADASPAQDGTVKLTTGAALNAGDLLLNTSGVASTDTSAVLVFQLPALPTGEIVGSASLNFRGVPSGATGLPTEFNVDLYGLDFRAASAVLGSDFFRGTLDTNAAATLIQDNILTSAVTGAGRNVTTSVAGGAALTGYLNDQYLAGGTGQFIFLRFSTDNVADIARATGYFIGASENANNPILTINTVVPEPASLALLAAGGLIALGRRRAHA